MRYIHTCIGSRMFSLFISLSPQSVAKALYERVMQDRELSKAAAMVCDKLANLDKEGTRFRSTILSLLQVDYKGKPASQRSVGQLVLGF